MKLRLVALALVLLGLAAGSAGSAGSTELSPLARALVVPTRDDPHAGRPFAGYVVVLPAAARRGLVSVDASCPGTVLGRAVPGRASRVPEGSSVPAVLVCTWAIPRDRVGWTFRGRMEVDLQRRLANGDVELETDEGRLTRWIVQP